MCFQFFIFNIAEREQYIYRFLFKTRLALLTTFNHMQIYKAVKSKP